MLDRSFLFLSSLVMIKSLESLFILKWLQRNWECSKTSLTKPILLLGVLYLRAIHGIFKFNKLWNCPCWNSESAMVSFCLPQDVHMYDKMKGHVNLFFQAGPIRLFVPYKRRKRESSQSGSPVLKKSLSLSSENSRREGTVLSNNLPFFFPFSIWSKSWIFLYKLWILHEVSNPIRKQR